MRASLAVWAICRPHPALVPLPCLCQPVEMEDDQGRDRHVQYLPEDADLRILLLQWYRRARQAQLAHGDAANRYGVRARRLGIPVVVLSALVGTSVFATLTQQVAPWLRIITGLLSITAAVLAALQTFFRSSDLSSEHRIASRDFGALRRHIGQLGAVGGKSREVLLETLDEIRKRYDEASGASPNIPEELLARRRAGTNEYFPPEFSLWPEGERLRE